MPTIPPWDVLPRRAIFEKVGRCLVDEVRERQGTEVRLSHTAAAARKKRGRLGNPVAEVEHIDPVLVLGLLGLALDIGEFDENFLCHDALTSCGRKTWESPKYLWPILVFKLVAKPMNVVVFGR
jgi:hypothetical protein